MPIEVEVWRIAGSPTRLAPSRLQEEAKLEDYIAADPTLVRSDLWVIGRQVQTEHGGFIDLLAMDPQGHLVVLELKRHKTPRDVVAQTLDYASWVRTLGREDIERIYDGYARRRGGPVVPFDQGFVQRFGGQVPDALNEAHELIVVAAALDDSTERILGYLESFEIPVNAVFFRVFKDGDREYLTGAWLRDPAEAQARTEETQARQKGKEPWNGNDFYVSFGGRNWEDVIRYGFVSAGGGSWYTKTLYQLRPGNRVFVHIPGVGYTGIGEVEASATPVSEFEVTVDGKKIPISSAKLRSSTILEHAGDAEKTEVLVRVKWLKTVPEDAAIWEQGFFANQNSACKLRSKFTIERLVERFGLKD